MQTKKNDNELVNPLVETVTPVAPKATPRSTSEAVAAKQGAKEFYQKWETLRANALEVLGEENIWATFDPTGVKKKRQEVGAQIQSFAASSPDGVREALGTNTRAIMARMEEFRLFPGLGELFYSVAVLAEEKNAPVDVYARYLSDAPETEWSHLALNQLKQATPGYSFKTVNADKAELLMGNRKIFRPRPTTRQDVIDFATLAGAEISGQDGFQMFGEVFYFDDAGSLNLGKKSFAPVAIVTAEGCHETTEEQSALIALLMGYNATLGCVEDWQKKSQFNSVIQEVCSQLLESAEWGYVDPERALDKALSLKVVGLSWTGSIQVLSAQRREVSEVDLDKGFRQIHPEYRIVVANGRYYPGGVRDGNGKVYAISTDTAKGAKRMRMSACTQLEPKVKTESSVVYRGAVGHGSLVEVLLAPDGLPTLFGLAPGGVVDLTAGKFGNVMSVWDRKTYSGTSFAIRSEEDREKFEESLPKVGDQIGEVLAIHGASSRRIPRGERGIVTKVRVVSESRQYRNLRWLVTVEFLDESGDHKVRGGLKAMVCKANVARLRDTKILHKDILKNHLAVAGWEGEHLLASMDAFKGTGKGNARFRVELASESIRHFLPVVEAFETLKSLLPSKAIDAKGRVIYQEDWDVEGVYDALVSEYQRRFSKEVKVGRTLTKNLFDALLKAYAKGREIVWSEITESGVDGKSAAFEVFRGIMGNPVVLVFTAYDNGRYSVVQQTTVFRSAMLLKAEHVGVRDVCTRAPMMLEVAYAAKAMGMDKLAKFIEEGGRKRAKGVVKINDFANGTRYTEGPTVHGVDVMNTSEEEAEMLREILDGDLAEWPEKLYVYATDGKQIVTLGQNLLHVIPYESPQFGAIRGILESGLAGDQLRLGNFVRVLKSGLQKMTQPQNAGFWKKLHSGGDSIYCKMVPIPGDHEGVHQEIHVNPHGPVARDFARDFDCKKSELNGKWVVSNRDPMFAPIVLRIVLNPLIGLYVVGVSDYTLSKHNGDADGDTTKALAITDSEVVEEVKGFDAGAVAEAIHEASHVSDPFHWVEQNTLVDGKHNAWAKATVVGEDKIAMVDQGTIKSYRNEMPKDANAAHLALSIASLGLGSMGEFSVLEANALMFSVYEAELGGYNPKFAKVHEVFSSVGMPYAEKVSAFKQAAAELDLKEEFASAWFRVLRAKSSVDKLCKDGVKLDGQYVMQNIVYGKAPLAERLAVVPRLIAKAMKLLAQGQVTHPLMLNLDRAVVQNFVLVKTDEGSKAVPVIGLNGEVEGRNLASVINKFAGEGNPGAVRLRFFMNHVLPILRAKGARSFIYDENTLDEEYYG